MQGYSVMRIYPIPSSPVIALGPTRKQNTRCVSIHGELLEACITPESAQENETSHHGEGWVGSPRKWSRKGARNC